MVTICHVVYVEPDPRSRPRSEPTPFNVRTLREVLERKNGSGPGSDSTSGPSLRSDAFLLRTRGRHASLGFPVHDRTHDLHWVRHRTYPLGPETERSRLPANALKPDRDARVRSRSRAESDAVAAWVRRRARLTPASSQAAASAAAPLPASRLLLRCVLEPCAGYRSGPIGPAKDHVGPVPRSSGPKPRASGSGSASVEPASPCVGPELPSSARFTHYGRTRKREVRRRHAVPRSGLRRSGVRERTSGPIGPALPLGQSGAPPCQK